MTIVFICIALYSICKCCLNLHSFDNPSNLKFKDTHDFQMHFDVLNTKIKVIIFLTNFTFIEHILSLKY